MIRIEFCSNVISYCEIASAKALNSSHFSCMYDKLLYIYTK